MLHSEKKEQKKKKKKRNNMKRGWNEILVESMEVREPLLHRNESNEEMIFFFFN